MFDVDKFIQIVEENPAIWEKGTKEYSDRNLREKSWNVVGENMFSNWSDMTYEERSDQVRQMKSRWRHIRDNFMKFLNQGRNGLLTSKRKKYMYADALMFLLETIENKRRRHQQAVEEKDEEEELTLKLEEEELILKLEEEEEEEEPDIITNGCISIEKTNNVIQPEVSMGTNNTRKYSNFRNFPITIDNPKTEDDADKLFLLSLLPYMQKLNDKEKLDFRFHALQFFRNTKKV